MAGDRDATDTIIAFLETVHPYDSLPREELSRVADLFVPLALPAGEAVYAFGETLDGLYLIRSGRIEIHDRNGALVSLLGPRKQFRRAWPPARRQGGDIGPGGGRCRAFTVARHRSAAPDRRAARLCPFLLAGCARRSRAVAI